MRRGRIERSQPRVGISTLSSTQSVRTVRECKWIARQPTGHASTTASFLIRSPHGRRSGPATTLWTYCGRFGSDAHEHGDSAAQACVYCGVTVTARDLGHWMKRWLKGCGRLFSMTPMANGPSQRLFTASVSFITFYVVAAGLRPTHVEGAPSSCCTHQRSVPLNERGGRRRDAGALRDPSLLRNRVRKVERRAP